MFKYAKLSFIVFISVVLIPIICVILSAYINDPLQVWHKPFHKKTIYSHMRESAHARMQNGEFDSVIVGNSYSECTSSKKANKILGGKFINLSMSGSNMPEKKLVLKRAFESQKVKRVVYIFDEDIHYLNLEIKSKYPDSWMVLYDNNPFNDIKIYLNNKYILCNLLFKKCITDGVSDIDKAADWENDEVNNRRFGGFENWMKYYPEDEQTRYVFNTIYKSSDNIYKGKIDTDYKDKIRQYFDEYIFELVKKYPDTEFDFILSPKCNLQLAIDIRDNTFIKKSAALEVFAHENDKYKNSKFFAFDDEENIGLIKDFKDFTHYRSKINYYILEAIKNDTNRITASNVDKYLNGVQTKAKNVDFQKYKQLVKKVYVNQQ